jgi:hypothetical protein
LGVSCEREEHKKDGHDDDNDEEMEGEEDVNREIGIISDISSMF